MKSSQPSRVRVLARALMLTTAGAGIVLALNCGSSDGSLFSDEAPCDGVIKDKCGGACTDDATCGESLYCAGGHCTADCYPGARPCPNNLSCSPHGRCGSDPFPPPFHGDSGEGDGSCADIEVTLAKVTPTVVLLVDQSGSMTADFPPGSGTSRWDVLRNALVSPDGGIIKTLQNDVAFGLTLYTGESEKPGGICPLLTSVKSALADYSAIFNAYAAAKPDDNTPTAESIMAVIGFNDAGKLNGAGLAAAQTPGPKILILATDGDPDTCAAPNSNGTQPPRDFSVWAAQRTYDAGIKTYVIGVGADIDLDHQQQVANVGLGFPADAGDAGAPLFRTDNKAQLEAALNQIILGVRDCKFTLNGAVVSGTESQGKVTLNGAALSFNDPNGWKLDSATQLEIVGNACTTLKNTVNATLSVRFPCGSIIPR